MAESTNVEICHSCGSLMDRVITIPTLSGTRDSFGVGKEFVDPESGKLIDTWKKWEGAGYKQLKDSKGMKRRMKCNEKIKEKKDKLKGKITV